MKVGVLCLVLYVSLASGLELNFSFEEKLPADTRWVELTPGSVENLGDIYSFCSECFSHDPSLCMRAITMCSLCSVDPLVCR